MKYFFLTLLVIFSLNASAKTLVVGLIEYPPHVSFENDVKKSKLYKYLNNTFSPAGYEIQIIKYPNKRGFVELEKGIIDMLLPFDENLKNLRLLSKPLFHSIPGLCFKKDKFIPILSATHKFNNLIVGIPPGVTVLDVLKNSGAILVDLAEGESTKRGIDLAQRGRIDAFYHPSPIKVYHQNNPHYKEVACSYFHGYPTGVHIAVSPKFSEEEFKELDALFTEAINKRSYEYYFALSEQ